MVQFLRRNKYLVGLHGEPLDEGVYGALELVVSGDARVVDLDRNPLDLDPFRRSNIELSQISNFRFITHSIHYTVDVFCT